MMNRKRFDMGDFADKRSRSGHRFTAIVVDGDQEKYSEIIGRLANTILELAKSIPHQDAPYARWRTRQCDRDRRRLICIKPCPSALRFIASLCGGKKFRDKNSACLGTQDTESVEML